jgi:beta-lactamase class A
MTSLPSRRTFLLAAAALPLALTGQASAADASEASPSPRFAALERTFGGRLGVFAENTGNGAQLRYRADERFPFCSTFKVILAGAVLARSVQAPDLLQRRIRYTQEELAHYSPISAKHLGAGMTVAELCAAALQYSDNTAANLLIKLVGGPPAVTAYGRSIGNASFRLDRRETELNSALPGDLRDTATPASMAHSLQALALGPALPPPQRKQLNDWLLGNTTGAKRIRAAIPAGWQVGDKTGSGDYGTANDIALLRPPRRRPIVVAVYHTQDDAAAKWNDEVIAAAARIVVEDFG